jgi:hypothetical protein
MDVQSFLSPILLRRRKRNFLNHFSSNIYRQQQNNLKTNDSIEFGKVTNTFMSYFIETMGCQMNLADSERIQGQLDYLGYQKSSDIETASLIILNTCSIRDHAENKVYSHLGPHALRKRKGDDITLIVTGCVAQQEGDDILKR